MKPGNTIDEIRKNIQLSQAKQAEEKLAALDAEKKRLLASHEALCESVGIDYAGPFGKASDF